MRICIPLQPKLQGGGNNFIANFLKYLDARGIRHTEHISDRYDVLFTLHWVMEYEGILAGVRRNPRVRIVHRIDGSAEDYGREQPESVDTTQKLINRLADLTIFQSEYCRHSTREKFPLIVHDGPVIYNPVDVEQFRPDGETINLQETVNVACATWSTNPMKGARSLYAAAQANPDIGFIMCGRYPDAPTLPNVHIMGMLGRDALARTLRSCDILYFPSENEACPNVVLEALASGLPVLYKDSGATPELVADCGLPAEVGTFREQLESVMEQKDVLAALARERAVAEFNPDLVLSRYVYEIERALERPTDTPVKERRKIAWSPRQIARYHYKRVGRAARDRIKSLTG